MACSGFLGRVERVLMDDNNTTNTYEPLPLPKETPQKLGVQLTELEARKLRDLLWRAGQTGSLGSER